MEQIKPFRIKLQTKKSILGVFTLVGVVCFLIASGGPVIMTSDSVDTWNQVLTRNFSNHHPAIFQIYVWILSLGGISPALYSFLQLILLASTVITLIKLLSPVSQLNPYFTTAAILSVPFFGFLGITMWKDIPYSCLNMLALALVITRPSKQRLSIAVVLMGLATSFRHEGIFNLLLFLVVANIIYFLKNKKNRSRALFSKGILISFFVVLGSICSSVLLTNTLGIKDGKSWAAYSPFIMDLAYINAVSPELVPRDVSERVSQIYSGESREAAKDCRWTDRVFWGSGWSNFEAEKLAPHTPGLWWRTLGSSAGAQMILGHLCRASIFLPPPFSRGPVEKLVFGTAWGISESSLGPVPTSYSSALSSFMNALRVGLEDNWNFLLWPGLHLFVVLFLSYRFRQVLPQNFFLIPTFLVCRHLILIWTSTGPAARYGLTTSICSIVMLLAALQYWHRKRITTLQAVGKQN